MIKKNNKLIAHSLLWRNGDLLCINSIEVPKVTVEIVFFRHLFKIRDEIIIKSFETKSIKECIKKLLILI